MSLLDERIDQCFGVLAHYAHGLRACARFGASICRGTRAKSQTIAAPQGLSAQNPGVSNDNPAAPKDRWRHSRRAMSVFAELKRLMVRKVGGSYLVVDFILGGVACYGLLAFEA